MWASWARIVRDPKFSPLSIAGTFEFSATGNEKIAFFFAVLDLIFGDFVINAIISLFFELLFGHCVVERFVTIDILCWFFVVFCFLLGEFFELDAERIVIDVRYCTALAESLIIVRFSRHQSAATVSAGADFKQRCPTFGAMGALVGGETADGQTNVLVSLAFGVDASVDSPDGTRKKVYAGGQKGAVRAVGVESFDFFAQGVDDLEEPFARALIVLVRVFVGFGGRGQCFVETFA